jgi:hypothetical protein
VRAVEFLRVFDRLRQLNDPGALLGEHFFWRLDRESNTGVDRTRFHEALLARS